MGVLPLSPCAKWRRVGLALYRCRVRQMLGWQAGWELLDYQGHAVSHPLVAHVYAKAAAWLLVTSHNCCFRLR